MEHGVEAYRKNDFPVAEKNWSGLPGADAAYNRGNALAKAGDYDAAIAAYDDALRQQPGNHDEARGHDGVVLVMRVEIAHDGPEPVHWHIDNRAANDLRHISLRRRV